MNRKMDLLERAHGLLCNIPGDGGSAEDGEQWHKLRAEWIERWVHVIRDQQIKHHNKQVRIGNDAITAYQEKSTRRRRANVQIRDLVDGVRPAAPTTVAETGADSPNWRVINCPDHGTYALDLNGPREMCGECRVVGPDGNPLGSQDDTGSARPAEETS